MRTRCAEAMQLVVRYGDKIWEKFPEPPENPGGSVMSNVDFKTSAKMA